MCENKPLISVIIPVYKVEEYLDRCISSILSQTYDNLEIILVDDGSPDRCGEMCDDWAQKDNRIVVLHRENGGLSAARNEALAVFRGAFITCIDSDDWVSEYYIQNLYNALSEDDAELAISCFENVFADKPIRAEASEELIGYKCLSREECFQKLLYQDALDISAWGKLYKREIIADLRYPIGKLYEDVPVTTQTVHRADKIAVIANVDYYYFQRSSSIQYQQFSPRKMDGVSHVQDLQRFILTEYPALRKASSCRVLSATCNMLFQLGDIKQWPDEYALMWSLVKKNRRTVLLDAKARKKARAAALLSYFGYPIMKKIYSLSQMRG